MRKTTSRIIGSVLLLAALGFLWGALHHPEWSWPWSNTISFALYGGYALVTIVLLIAPFKEP